MDGKQTMKTAKIMSLENLYIYGTMYTVVCLWIIRSEDKSTITNLLVEFKKHNEKSSSIQCVMTNKDITEWDVIKEQLP